MMLGMPIRMVAGSILLIGFIVVPQILEKFGFTNDVVAFLLLPLVAFALLIIIFAVYIAPFILNPVRFVILVPCIVVFAGLLTYGLYM